MPSRASLRRYAGGGSDEHPQLQWQLIPPGAIAIAAIYRTPLDGFERYSGFGAALDTRGWKTLARRSSGATAAALATGLSLLATLSASLRRVGESSLRVTALVFRGMDE